MEDRLLDKIAEPFNLQLPEYATLEAMIDGVLPAVATFSERNLLEEGAPLYTTNWVKMTDRPGATAVELYRFQGFERGEIRVVTDGVVSAQAYEVEESGDRIIIGQSIMRDSFLYELAFMDADFLIFQRHGNKANITHRYLFFCREAIGTRLTWNEALERLVDKYRNSQFPLLAVGLIVAALIAVMLYLR
ncbi:hypothetical protein LEM8419_01170 [Neolewinella maritima]|uniref:Uncharacterized protein n=1 Tax=Neolewinella maritima TaxID=1383882 RepID=A0ABM9AZG4_9BACT|nr:hypothetical protein [Neolewinella maritima]CAH0999924.1 hypothetical protein LEM8419_01170 [Neolewinella maritima]